MKPRSPNPQSTDEAGYPSLAEHHATRAPGASRRAFLRVAGAVTTASASGLLLGPAAAAARRRKRPQPTQVTLRLKRRYTFRYGNYQLQRCVAQTRSAPLARFLKDRKEADGIEKALRAILDRHSCADLLSGKRLARLQRALGRALRAHYQRRTRHAAPTPTVVLYVGPPP